MSHGLQPKWLKTGLPTIGRPYPAIHKFDLEQNPKAQETAGIVAHHVDLDRFSAQKQHIDHLEEQILISPLFQQINRFTEHDSSFLAVFCSTFVFDGALLQSSCHPWGPHHRQHVAPGIQQRHRRQAPQVAGGARGTARQGRGAVRLDHLEAQPVLARGFRGRDHLEAETKMLPKMSRFGK